MNKEPNHQIGNHLNSIISSVRVLAAVVVLSIVLYSYNFRIDRFDVILIIAVFLLLTWALCGVMQAILNYYYVDDSQQNASEDRPATNSMLLEEYRQTFEIDRHLTSLNWQIASIFVAGVFLAIGTVLAKRPARPPFGPSLGIIALLGIIVMVTWYLFVRRNREIVNIALARAQQIEAHPDGLVTKMRSAGKHGRVRVGNRLIFVPSPSGFTTVQLFVSSFLIALIVLLYFSFFPLSI